MLNFVFDEYGYLEPYETITTNIEELEYYFVHNFPNSNTRQKLFVNYLRYIENFRTKVTSHFEQWINGSFISQKENPKDIDFVTFLDYEIYETQEPYLDKFWSFSLEDKGLDAYLVKVYPKEHLLHQKYVQDTIKWNLLYSQSKIKQQKGFLKLIFS